MNKLFLYFLPLLLAANVASAQPDRVPGEDRPSHERAERGTPGQRKARFARIRAARKAFLTEQLALTEKEAAAFFPIYWAYDEQTREARRATNDKLANRSKSGPLTELEAQEALLLDRTLRQELLTLRNQTEDKFLKILPASKIIRLPEIEKEFRKKLWDRTRGPRR